MKYAAFDSNPSFFKGEFQQARKFKGLAVAAEV